MPRRYIWSDSITAREIDGPLWQAKISLTLTPADNEGKADEKKAETQEAEWDLSEVLSEALSDLLTHSDLAEFLIRVRPLVALGTPDSETIRKWARAEHPELSETDRAMLATVKERGRIPAEVSVIYRREVVAKVK